MFQPGPPIPGPPVPGRAAGSPSGLNARRPPIHPNLRAGMMGPGQTPPTGLESDKLQEGMNDTISQDFTNKTEDLSILAQNPDVLVANNVPRPLARDPRHGPYGNPPGLRPVGLGGGMPPPPPPPGMRPGQFPARPEVIRVRPPRRSNRLLDSSSGSSSSNSGDSDSESDRGSNKSEVIALQEQIREKLAGIPGLETIDDSPQGPLIDYLIKSVARLSAENTMLKADRRRARTTTPMLEIPHDENGADSEEDRVPILRELHYVSCKAQGSRVYSDVPAIPKLLPYGGVYAYAHLRGHFEVEDLTEYLSQHHSIAFAFVNRHVCPCSRGRLNLEGPEKQQNYESSKANYILLSGTLVEALNEIIRAHPSRFPEFGPDLSTRCYEPYLPFYWRNKDFLELARESGLTPFGWKSVQLLGNWLEDLCRNDWDQADRLIDAGKITERHLQKLFRPNDLLLHHNLEDKRKLEAWKVRPYPWHDENDCEVDCNYWSFSGVFQKNVHYWPTNDIPSRGSVRVDKARKKDVEVDITSLDTYPIRFAPPGTLERLIARGHKIWSCRKKKLISYNDPEKWGNSDKTADHRFMIDYVMYRRMHPGNHHKFALYGRDDLGPEAMRQDEPPSDDFLATLPAEIHGFEFETKGWRLLNAEYITDVTWNKDAFKRLVLPNSTKELIQAAVMAHGHHPGASLDIVANKGRGLLILLHGSPGTGKTLTAESIAEAQERPLYRVTCGDVGTEAGKVEKYLESVLEIGKAWGCVVLLDEADVFMEERTTADQTQNAIVSVFLRVLEYYDGILILTTNRVGTFDEAFKSRIHLALPYSKLDEEQRLEIWRNFIHMLSKSPERVDIRDLEMNINKLAQFDLNGRQIRNVVTLARYLAKFRKQMLVYKHIYDALDSVVKFDEYLLQLRGSDDQWAAESKIRLEK